MSQHTKGPWEIKKAPFSYEYVSICADVGNIGYVNNIRAYMGGTLESEFKELGVTQEMCEANARLIQAAPEMFELLDLLDNDCVLRAGVQDQIRELVNKVKGLI